VIAVHAIDFRILSLVTLMSRTRIKRNILRY